MIDEVRKRLFKLQDTEYKKFHSSLLPGIDNIIGVRVPEIRKLVKELLKSDYINYLENNTNLYYEETMVEGLIIATSKIDIDTKINYLRKFIPKIDNWAVCDICCSGFKLGKDDKDKLWNFILEYSNSNKEFELRFMIVMMMDYFLDDNYLDEVFKIIDSIYVDYYYTNMAIAWLISVAFVKKRDFTFNYLKNNKLSLFTYNNSLQKIIESNRVTKLDKEVIKKMKKR